MSKNDSGSKRPGVGSSGHRSRLRTRFLTAGARGLAEYELLELLLTFALPRIDTKPIAKALLARFGGLAGVLGAAPADLQQVRGVGPRAAVLLSLMQETCTACLRTGIEHRDLLNSPTAVAEYARMALAGKPTEVCLALFLSAKNELLGEEVVAEGTVDRAPVLRRRIIELALARKAAGLILVHNHPSGAATPSAEDDLLTRELRAAARAVDLRFLDHLIVAADGTYSYRQAGAL
ncbi:MAG: DNA repair protein RadC [Planctomycetes bacterium]|nr:DNA repair protein RadC [Planctomycetota bacterium]